MAVRNLARERGVELPDDAPHPRRRQRRRRPVDRRRRRGHRRHRAGPGAHPRRARSTASPWSPPTRSCWPTSAPSCSPAAEAAGRRPPVRGGRGRRHPAHPGAAREPRRRADPPGARHRQRHHQLHPHEDDRGGRRLLGAPCPRPSASATPSATPPPTSRASTPGPRRPSSPPSPSASGSWPATCTTRASAASRPSDIAVAHRLGYVVKLLAIAEQDRGDGRGRRCASTRRWCPPAIRWPACGSSFNAVFVEGDAVGQLMFYGRGAGGRPTASAVLGDVIDAAVNLRKGTHGIDRLARPGSHPPHRRDVGRVLPPPRGGRPAGRAPRRDRRVRRARREHPRGRAGGLGDEARLVFITHEAREADVQATLRDLRHLDVVEHVGGPAAGDRG